MKLQKVVAERFLEPVGAHAKHSKGFYEYLLVCGHSIVRHATRGRGEKMRCYKCPAVPTHSDPKP